jgi:hypothetical protein
VGKLVAMLCSPCVTSHILCMFFKASMKCLECVQKEVVYDGNFSADAFDKLIVERH